MFFASSPQFYLIVAHLVCTLVARVCVLCHRQAAENERITKRITELKRLDEEKIDRQEKEQAGNYLQQPTLCSKTDGFHSENGGCGCAAFKLEQEELARRRRQLGKRNSAAKNGF